MWELYWHAFQCPSYDTATGGSLWVCWSPSFSCCLSSSCRVAGASLGLLSRGDFSLNCLDPLSHVIFTLGNVGHWWPLIQSLGSLSGTFLSPEQKAEPHLHTKQPDPSQLTWTAHPALQLFCFTRTAQIKQPHHSTVTKDTSKKKIIVQSFCSHSK